MDEGYLNPDVNAYVDWIGRKMIRAHRGIAATPMNESDTLRCKVGRCTA